MFLERFGNISLLFEQADTNLTVAKFAAISAVMGVSGIGLGVVLRIHAGDDSAGVPADGRRCRCAGCCSAASAG